MSGGGTSRTRENKAHGRGTTDRISHTTEDLGVNPVAYALESILHCQRDVTLSQHEFC
jgi:hypothetical protein